MLSSIQNVVNQMLIIKYIVYLSILNILDIDTFVLVQWNLFSIIRNSIIQSLYKMAWNHFHLYYNYFFKPFFIADFSCIVFLS